MCLKMVPFRKTMKNKHEQRDLESSATVKSSNLQHKTKSTMLKEYEEQMGKPGNKRPLSRIPLWYFLHEILEVGKCHELIGWEDEENLAFTIKKPKELAILWGQIKNKENMTYPKLARGIRYYYGKGVIEKFNGKRFSYKFIVSNKTKKVLLKRKNLPQEASVQPLPKYKARKRKSSTPDSSNINEKKPNTVDSPSIMNGSDWGSDEDESLSDSDLKSIDQCLSEMFKDPKFEAYVSKPEKNDDTGLFFMSNRNTADDVLKLPPSLVNMYDAPVSNNKTSRYVKDSQDGNSIEKSQNMEIFDIYRQLTEETNTIVNDPFPINIKQEADDSDYLLEDIKPDLFPLHSVVTSNTIKPSYRKKSKSESECYYDIYDCQTPSQGMLRTNASLPNFSTADNSRPGFTAGFYTNFLLQNNTLSQALDTVW